MAQDGDLPWGMRVERTRPGSVDGMVHHFQARQGRADLIQRTVRPDSQRLSQPSVLSVLPVG